MTRVSESGDTSLCSSRRLCGIVGVGVDLVDVGDLRRLLESDRGGFTNTVWTANERHDAEGNVERLAARWAAKEAVMKALGTGLREVDPFDVETVSLPTGALNVRLYRSASAAATRIGVGCVHVSISHKQGCAVAIAVASAPHLGDRTPLEDTYD